MGVASSAWGSGAGTVATGPFDLGTSAVIAGTGGAAATVGGLWSLTYNPAGLADVKYQPSVNFYEFQVGASYLKWFEDQSVAYGAVALPPGFAVGVANFDQGTITTSTGFVSGATARVSDFGAIAGWGTTLPGSQVSVGLAAQYWQRNLASYKASTFAINLGTRVLLFHQQVAVGAYVKNLGPSLNFETSEHDDQPLAGTLGASWTKPDAKSLGLRVVADMTKPKDNGIFAAGGVEATLQKVLMVRAGFNSSRAKTEPTFGVGLAYGGFTFDYAYSDVNLLDEQVATHMVSIRFSPN
jgi:hypothetical protein